MKYSYPAIIALAFLLVDVAPSFAQGACPGPRCPSASAAAAAKAAAEAADASRKAQIAAKRAQVEAKKAEMIKNQSKLPPPEKSFVGKVKELVTPPPPPQPGKGLIISPGRTRSTGVRG